MHGMSLLYASFSSGCVWENLAAKKSRIGTKGCVCRIQEEFSTLSFRAGGLARRTTRIVWPGMLYLKVLAECSDQERYIGDGVQ